MGYGLEASCMCIRISRHASRGPLEAVLKPLGGRVGGGGGGGGGGHREKALGHGYGLEASCMCMGISRNASRVSLECSFEATWVPFRSLWDASGGFLGASWEPLGGFWRPLGAL